VAAGIPSLFAGSVAYASSKQQYSSAFLKAFQQALSTNGSFEVRHFFVFNASAWAPFLSCQHFPTLASTDTDQQRNVHQQGPSMLFSTGSMAWQTAQRSHLAPLRASTPCSTAAFEDVQWLACYSVGCHHL
jgi:hypothetical protein